MSTQGNPGSNEAIQSNTPDAEQVEIQIDDRSADVSYSMTSRVWGSAEEICIDFGGGLKRSNNQAVVKVDQRIILSPWGAKRLAMALGQVVGNYERAYGPLELDQRKRLKEKPGQAGGNG